MQETIIDKNKEFEEQIMEFIDGQDDEENAEERTEIMEWLGFFEGSSEKQRYKIPCNHLFTKDVLKSENTLFSFSIS